MAPSTTGRERKAPARGTAARETAEKGRSPAKSAPRKARKSDANPQAPARQTGADVELDADVLEFIEALGRYKQEHNKPFPSWSEVLHVLRSLGYRKHA